MTRIGFQFVCLMASLWLSGMASAEEQNAAFDILEYRVEGNTVLPVGKVEEAVYPHLGEGKSVDDAEKARAALEKAFHDAGYLTVFVNIPEQKVDAGVVRLEVQEGQVEKLRVVGSRYYALGAIKERVPEFAEGNVPYFPKVQKQLASINGTPDRQVAPVLRPGKTPGKVEVDLKVQDKLPFHGGIELNNRYSANTTHTRLNGSMRYDNLWQLDHSLGISFQVTPENTDETKVFSATYLIPTGGDYWALYGVVSKSDIAAVGDFNIIGRGNIYGVRYIHPMPGLDGYSHSLTLGMDYKDFEDTNQLTTPISYLPLYVGYDSTLNGESSSTSFNLGLTFSVRGLADQAIECETSSGPASLNEFGCKRFNAKANMAYLRGEIKHTHNLYKDWQLFANLSGQYSNQPLISSEQFALGGVDTVRGYIESNSLGDNGANVTLELRTPSLAKYLSNVNSAYAHAFFDAGHLRVRDPLEFPSNPEFNQKEHFNLASVGFGLQLKGWRGMSGALEFARALRTAGQVDAGDFRMHFRVGYDW